MTLTEYSAWSTNYAARVGLNYEAGLEMLAAWFPDIAGKHITLETLRQAGDIAVGRITAQPPSHREKHRGILFDSIDAVIIRARGTDGMTKTQKLCDDHRRTDSMDRALWRRLVEAQMPDMARKWSSPP